MLSLVGMEATTPIFETQLRDAADQPVDGSTLDAILLTLYDEATEAIINGRDHQAAFNVDVSVDTQGWLRWTLEVEDMPILQEGLAEEAHIALFEVFWSSGGTPHLMRERVRIIVTNLAHVPNEP